jgi:hypothetical protein
MPSFISCSATHCVQVAADTHAALLAWAIPGKHKAGNRFGQVMLIHL